MFAVDLLNAQPPRGLADEGHDMTERKAQSAWQPWGLGLVVLLVLVDVVWVLRGHDSRPVPAPVLNAVSTVSTPAPKAAAPVSTPVPVPVAVPVAVAAPAAALPASVPEKTASPTPPATASPDKKTTAAVPTTPASVTVAKHSASARWVQSLPPESRVVVHLQAASLREADNFRQAHQPLLANARVLQITEPGGRAPRYLLVSGPFRSPERARNYIQRLDWRDKASSLVREALLEQASR